MSRVVAALSGGVDSATAAARLVDEGHEVIGMTLQLYNARGTSASAGGRCCGPRDIEDARRVCAHLGIPHYVVDMEDSFTTHVVEQFVDSYLHGETPNPCARCNEHIKFTPLLKRARALGADTLVTGHYARIEQDMAGKYGLMRGRDADKDQSYFLFAMPADELASIRFPLGDMTKTEVRALAEKYDLPNAQKPESQEICFIPDGNYAGFVERRAAAAGTPFVPGDIVHEDGHVVAQHEGIHRFTIGQRKGLGQGGTSLPIYVKAVEPSRGQVIVGPKESLAQRHITVRDLVFFGDEPRVPNFAAGVQIRHRGRPVPSHVTIEAGLATVVADGDGFVAAPGQAAVFYDGDRVIGGGWIQRACEASA